MLHGSREHNSNLVCFLKKATDFSAILVVHQQQADKLGVWKEMQQDPVQKQQ